MSTTRIYSSFPSKSSNIVIIGAGPIGLFAAILLKKKGIQNITVIDPRANSYTRSNDFSPEIFSMFSQLLEIPIKPSAAYHIKELEKALYQHATKNLDITFIKESFLGFENGKVSISNTEEKNSRILPADIVFDCTGSKRCVIKKINELQSNHPPFEIKPHKELARIPFIFARGTMTVKDHMIFMKGSKPNNVRELFSELGWVHSFMPIHYANRLDDEQNLLDIYKQVKVNLYTQAPDGLEDDAAKMKWVENLLKVTIGSQHSFTLLKPAKKPNKPRISYASSTYHGALPGYYFSSNPQFPTTFALGDALSEMPFILGSGLVTHAFFVAQLLACFQHINGTLLIDRETCKTLYKGFFNDRIGYVYHFIKKRGFTKELLDNQSDFTQLDLESYKHETLLISFNNDANKQKKLHDVAIKVKEHGVELFKKQNIEMAKQYFEYALSIYLDNFPDKYPNETAVLYSNLIICNKHDPEYVLALASKALVEVNRMTDNAAQKKLREKINHHVTVANEELKKRRQPDVESKNDLEETRRVSP